MDEKEPQPSLSFPPAMAHSPPSPHLSCASINTPVSASLDHPYDLHPSTHTSTHQPACIRDPEPWSSKLENARDRGGRSRGAWAVWPPRTPTILAGSQACAPGLSPGGSPAPKGPPIHFLPFGMTPVPGQAPPARVHWKRGGQNGACPDHMGNLRSRCNWKQFCGLAVKWIWNMCQGTRVSPTHAVDWLGERV